MTDNIVSFKGKGAGKLFNIAVWPIDGSGPERFSNVKDFAFLPQENIGGQTIFVISPTSMLDSAETLNELDASFLLPVQNYKAISIEQVDEE